MVKEGKAMVDASITDSPFKLKGKRQYNIATDRQEDKRESEDIKKEELQQKLIREEKPGVDSEARWLKKAGKLHYGYKKQVATDEEGMVEGVHTIPANEHDSKGLKSVLKKVPKKKKKEAFTDKGYKVPNNDEYLQKEGIKNRIQHNAYRNRPLTSWEIQFNKLISKQRYVVERTFGEMSRWFGAGKRAIRVWRKYMSNMFRKLLPII